MSSIPHLRIILGAAALLLATYAHADHVKVILMGGQSNMVGNSCLTSDLPPELQVPQNDVMFYNGGLTTLRPGSGQAFGPEITFGRTIEDTFPSETFCLMKYAVNGSSLLTRWNPSTGDVYASFNTRVANCITALTNAGHTYEFVGMLWTQGEAEASSGTTTPVYQAALNEFIADIRTRYGPNLPFFVSRLSSSQTSIAANGLSSIRAAQEYVAANDPYTYLVDTDAIKPNTDVNPEVNPDRLHFNAAGQMRLGETFGQSYAGSVVPDVTAPGIALLSPANGFTGHPATNDLVINFSEPIVFGTGSITVRKSADGTAVESFDVANPPANLSLNLSGATLTLDLSSNLSYSTGYYVEIAPTAIADNSGNNFAGLSVPSAWSFTTAAGQVGGLIAGSGITVSASSVNSTGKYPLQSVVNGAGLDASTGVHGTANYTEWNTNNGQTISQVWIAFDLGGSYVLDTMYVWNIGQFPSYGIQNVDIYVSDAYSPGDPEGAGSANWTKIGNNVTFAAAGSPNLGFDLETQTGISLPTTAVRHVRFEVNSNFSGSYVGLAEVQFFAASSGADTTAPTISSLNPANGASGVPTTTSPEITFSEPVAFGTGFITIRKTAGGSLVESYDVASPPANLTLTGSSLTINPSADFTASTGYYVEIGSNAITDPSGNSFAGISGSAAWSFITAAGQTGGLIAGSAITVTVSSINGTGTTFPPQSVVDGTGLNATTGVHGSGGGSEWYTNNGQSPVDSWISFDLGSSVVLDSIHVWNATQYINYGIKQVDIYVSNLVSPGDPEGAGAGDWTKIGTDVFFAAAGSPNVGFDLETQTGISLPATAVRHVRLESDTQIGGGTNYLGLAEVRFFAAGVGPGNDFADWIAGFNVGGQTGINDDYDNDGLGNALENLMGTSPEVFNPGLTPVSASGGNLVFRHTLSSTPALDLTGSYEWSANLVDWNASGAAAGGTAVTFGTPDLITPGTPNLVEVTSSVTGTPAAAIFARFKATQN